MSVSLASHDWSHVPYLRTAHLWLLGIHRVGCEYKNDSHLQPQQCLQHIMSQCSSVQNNLSLKYDASFQSVSKVIEISNFFLNLREEEMN